MEADCLSGSCLQKVSSGHDILVAIKRESLTIYIWKNSGLCLIQLFGVQAQKNCYTAKCRQQYSPAH